MDTDISLKYLSDAGPPLETYHSCFVDAGIT